MVFYSVHILLVLCILTYFLLTYRYFHMKYAMNMAPNTKTITDMRTLSTLKKDVSANSGEEVGE